MELVTKNIILYDEFGGVSGFAEFKIRGSKVDIKVRYNDCLAKSLFPAGAGNNFGGDVSQFCVTANGEAVGVFRVTAAASCFELNEKIDAGKEIFACVKKGEEIVASGVINQGRVDRRVEACEIVGSYPVEAIKELDAVFRKICIIDENGKGQCDGCPYREHFFGEAVESETEVVV